MTEGRKYDHGKIKYGLVPPASLEAIAKALTHGAQKYSANNWKSVEPYRYLDAAFRHLQSARLGEIIDEDSGQLHLALATTNLIFLLEKQLASEDNILEVVDEED